jgi:hypothetical protein
MDQFSPDVELSKRYAKTERSESGDVGCDGGGDRPHDKVGLYNPNISGREG